MTKIISNWVSPTGASIVGTWEKVEANSLISGISETGEPEHAGDTEIFWDTCTTQTDPNGRILFLDSNGEIWPFEELTRAPDAEEWENEE